MILPAVLLANSFFVAATDHQVTGGFKKDELFSLPEPGGFDSEKGLAKGRFLVAARRLKDPNFHKTVILLIRYGADGASGLVINRPLKVKISAVMPEIKELEQRKENLYLGGPVEPNKVLLLLKSAKTPEDSMPVFGDVYISSSRKELRRMITKTDKDERFRIYAGYAGWAPKQLESECYRGDWHVLSADAGTLFDKKPSEVWQELIQRFSVNWVRVKPDLSKQTPK
jgi:putative transcriptional regulator